MTALHGDLSQSRLKILEQIQAGVTGPREENREVRRRQDRMISDLNNTRGELRQLLDLVDVLRPLRAARGDGRQGRRSSYRPVAYYIYIPDRDADGIDISFATQNWRKAVRLGEGVPPSPRRGVARSSGTSNS
ncbi:hypothetical protein ABZV75_38865 [Streptomyces flaveolus]|uniref:hypothetical protein n=1 Tax=Streptomyces flaveolus TaxID=67297 RepID=UPI0033A737D6